MVQDIIEKLISHSACQTVACFLYEPEGSLPWSQKPVIVSYPEPAESCYFPHILISLRTFVVEEPE
jgi:hypothetical protein